MIDIQKDELIIDSFAGGGGASSGIEEALGRHIDIAINHNKEAISMHKRNHPKTLHINENVWSIDPNKVCDGRKVGLSWFSPDCTHHSRARGGKPVKKNIRGLAWWVLRWTKKIKPRVVVLENVVEFLDWGPLVKDEEGNERPCPKRKGLHFNDFVKTLKYHGYKVEWKHLIASDYGAPTIRKRLFMIARCDGQPIVWPDSTHGDPNKKDLLNRTLKPWRTASECIDFNRPCPSIFLTKEEARGLGFTRIKRPLADSTLRRIAKGIMKFVVDSADPFVIRTDMQSSNAGCYYNKNEPLRTITSSGGHAVVSAFLTEHANSSSQRNFNIDEPLRTQCAQVKGGHFAVVEAELEASFINKNYTGAVGQKVEKPLGTVTSVDHHSLTTAHVVKFKSDEAGQDAREPIHTLCSSTNHFGTVQAFLIEYYGNGEPSDLKRPLHTVTGRDRFGIVTIKGTDYQIIDIGMRMLDPDELYLCQGFKKSYVFTEGVSGKKFNKETQVKMCGNSVSPPVATAIIKSNFETQEIETVGSNRA